LHVVAVEFVLVRVAGVAVEEEEEDGMEQSCYDD
jgi:hypothetical protein